MPESVDLKGAFGLKPEDALRFFEAKGYRISASGWSEMMHDDHRDFTIAKVTNVDILVAFKKSLTKALDEGQTEATWKQAVTAELDTQGLLNNLGFNNWRFGVIYGTNLRMARAAGQWVRIQQAKANRPYLRYVATLDRRTRPAHRAWHATILPVDDKWWLTHFPPNGWNCRCTVQQLSERDMARFKYSVTPRPAGGMRGFRGVDGRVHNVPDGIDPGFGYNVGAGEMDRLATKAATSFTEANRVGLKGVAAQAFRDIVGESLGNIDAARVTRFDAALAAGNGAEIEQLVDETLKAGIARKGIESGVFGDKFRAAIADDNVRRFAVNEFARAAAADRQYVAKVPIATVDAASGATIKAATGVDVTGFERWLEAGTVRHALTQHGNAASEAARDQIALQPSDFALIEEVVANAYSVRRVGAPGSRKPERIEYYAEIDGRFYAYVETYGPAKRRLGALTLFKSWKRLDPR